jgi:stage V sporulation protein G
LQSICGRKFIIKELGQFLEIPLGHKKGEKMEITEVRIFLADEDRLKAYVTVTFDDCFVVRDLKVIRGNAGLFVAMPSKKKKDGTYKDIAHPINSDFRGVIEKTILEKYEDEIKMAEAGFPVKKSEDADFDEYEIPNGGKPGVGTATKDASENSREYEAGIGPKK